MTRDSLHQELMDIAAPLAAAQGLRIWGLEFSRGKRSLLRVYVESLENETGEAHRQHESEEPMAEAQGVSVEQCAHLSRSLGLALDVEDIMPGAYILEVSSPGLSRPFFSPVQMAGYLGETVELTTRDPVVDAFPGRRSFRGVLRHVHGERLSLEVEDGAEGDGAVVELRWDDLKKARLSPEIVVPAVAKEKKDSKKKKKHKKP